MNKSLNRLDFTSLRAFKESVSHALWKHTRIMAERIIYGIAHDALYKEVFLMYCALQEAILEEQQGLPPYEGRKTHSIRVNQTGANGDYFFIGGYKRKAGNTVYFKVIPPLDYFVVKVIAGGSYATSLPDNIYQFTMPDHDVNINIMYSYRDTNFTTEWVISDSMGAVKRACEGKEFHKSSYWENPVCAAVIPNYFTKWENPVCVGTSFTPKLQWENPKCVGAERVYALQWENPQCTGSAVLFYSIQWENLVCNGKELFYQLLWKNPHCTGEKYYYYLKWENATCVGEQRAFKTSWNNPVCTATEFNYSVKWESPYCAGAYIPVFSTQWERKQCTGKETFYYASWDSPICEGKTETYFYKKITAAKTFDKVLKVTKNSLEEATKATRANGVLMNRDTQYMEISEGLDGKVTISRYYLDFDLSKIPDGAKIQEVSLVISVLGGVNRSSSIAISGVSFNPDGNLYDFDTSSISERYGIGDIPEGIEEVNVTIPLKSVEGYLESGASQFVIQNYEYDFKKAPIEAAIGIHIRSGSPSVKHDIPKLLITYKE